MQCESAQWAYWASRGRKRLPHVLLEFLHILQGSRCQLAGVDHLVELVSTLEPLVSVSSVLIAQPARAVLLHVLLEDTLAGDVGLFDRVWDRDLRAWRNRLGSAHDHYVPDAVPDRVRATGVVKERSERIEASGFGVLNCLLVFEAERTEVVVDADGLELRNIDVDRWRKEVYRSRLAKGWGVGAGGRWVVGACVQMINLVTQVRITVEFVKDTCHEHGVGPFPGNVGDEVEGDEDLVLREVCGVSGGKRLCY